MYGVVGADQKIGADCRKLIGGREHEFTHTLPVAAVDALHVLGERVRMHRHLGMSVRAQKLRAFHADRAIAQRRTFSGASYDANVLGHEACQAMFYAYCVNPSAGVALFEQSEETRGS